MSILKFLFIAAEVVLLFNLVIIVHEIGHFLAARWRGLKVERFGIWFGKPIWQKKINGVIYCLGCIPAGGYVALPQMAPMEAIEGKNETPREELPAISALDKIIVAAAGPFFSLMLAFVFGTIVWVIGRPVSEKETTTTVGYVPTEYTVNEVTNEYPAHKVGIRSGDQIVAIDDHPVSRFSGVSQGSIMWRIVSSEGDTINVQVKRDNVLTNFNVAPIRPDTKSYQRKGLRQIGIEPSYSALVAKVIDNGPAAKAGIKINDFIVAVNGKTVHHPAHASDLIRSSTNGPIELKVERNGATMTVSLTPEIPVGEKDPRIGILWDDTGKMALVHPSPYEQVKTGVESMVGTFSALFSPKSDIKAQHLSGPVGIMRIYYLLFQSEQGWRLAIWFSVVLNVNLAILNMLPVPVLDGGHITLAMISAISRREIDSRVLNWIQTACVFLVIGYICYVSFYDVQDLKPAKEPKEVPVKDMKFAPDSATPTNSQK